MGFASQDLTRGNEGTRESQAQPQRKEGGRGGPGKLEGTHLAGETEDGVRAGDWGCSLAMGLLEFLLQSSDFI